MHNLPRHLSVLFIAWKTLGREGKPNGQVGVQGNTKERVKNPKKPFFDRIKSLKTSDQAAVQGSESPDSAPWLDFDGDQFRVFTSSRPSLLSSYHHHASDLVLPLGTLPCWLSECQLGGLVSVLAIIIAYSDEFCEFFFCFGCCGDIVSSEEEKESQFTSWGSRDTNIRKCTWI